MLALFLQALESILTIIFVVAIGFYLTKKGWFSENSSIIISRLVTSVSLPLYMIASLTKNFTFESLLKLASDMTLPIMSMLLAFLIGKIAAKMCNVRQGRRGIFVTNFFIANTMFIGLPVNLALFGDESIPSVTLYYIVNLAFFWTLGVQNIVADVNGQSENMFSKKTLKNLLSPPLIAFIIALIIIITNFRIPDFLMSGFQYAGNLTTPLSLIFIGIEIARINIKEFNFEKDIIYSLIGRFIVCPLCVLILTPFIQVSPISIKVFTMQAAMPAMTQMAIVSKQFNADSQYASALSFITILGGLLIIPIYMIVVNAIA